MDTQQTIDKLRDIRDKLAKVFESEVNDDVFDNGNLMLITHAITDVEKTIYEIRKRL